MSQPLSRNMDSDGTHLEPRVAKLEVGLDRLTEDVRSLAGIVRDQGSNVEKQLQALMVAVTEAQAPQKTDWTVIISAGLLVLAVGSAVFWPLNQTSQLNKDSIDRLAVKFENHENNPAHPVGLSMINDLERRMGLLEEAERTDCERTKDQLQLWENRAMGLQSITVQPSSMPPPPPNSGPRK